MSDFIKNKLREALDQEKRVKMEIPVPEDVLKIKDIFVKNGHKLYVVGGAVRDALLGKDPKDYDLATDAHPDKVGKMLKSLYKTVLPLGEAFGIWQVNTPTGEFEVATFRKDIGAGRRPDAVEFTDIHQDVNRRDLTINALFYDIDQKEVVDLVGGIADLKSGIVRTVGNPEDRFGEDRLRILRAIRFAARFGSDLDPAVDKALKKDAALKDISAERIRDEFLKGIKSAKSVTHFMSLIERYGLFKWIFPNLKVDKNFIEEKDPMVLLAFMLRKNEIKDIANVLNKMTYTSEEVRTINFLISLMTLSPETVVIMKKGHKILGVDDNRIREFAKLAGVNSKLIEAFVKFELSVSGKDAMDAGIPKGPEMGNFIQQKEIENFKEML